MSGTSASQLHELESLRIVRHPEPERGNRRFTWYMLIGLALVVALAVVGTVVYRRTLGRPIDVATVAVWPTATAQQPGVILTGSGYVVTGHKYIVVGTKVLGQIVEEPIEEGQRVRRGDLLARIDDRDYQAQLRQAIAERDLSEANVRLAEAKVGRRRELNSSGSISKEELDAAENDASVAQATLRRDEAAIDYAQFQVNQCRIVSPIDGIVLQKYRELGATINYGGQVQPSSGATDIAQLADTRDMRAEVDINESDIAKVTLGMPAVIVPDAYPDTRFDAMLVKIYPAADRQKATVKVEVQILRPDLSVIKPELSVKANFLERRAGAAATPRLIVPTKAVVRDRGASYVWTARDGVARRVAITAGQVLENGTEVTAGLHNGDIVIVAPPENLRDAQPVHAMSDGATGH
jgi:HlyD family secretion protein